MIGYLSGIVHYLEPQGHLDQLILNVSGVGYIITCPARVVEAKVGENAELWIHSITREDGTKLYGFAERTDVKGFLMMLDVQGVGAKVALALIAALGWQGLMDALAAGDVTSLTKADGVGKKLADRIVHEMGSKIEKLSGLQPVPNAGVDMRTAPIQTEAISALSNLGYSSHQAKQAVMQASKAAPKANIETLITLALQYLHEGAS